MLRKLQLIILGPAFGVLSALVGTMATAKPAAAFLLPAVLVLMISLYTAHELVFVCILFSRAASDFLMEEMRIAGGLSAGAVLNLFFVCYALFRLSQRSTTEETRKLALYWVPCLIITGIDGLRGPDVSAGIRLAIMIACCASTTILGAVYSSQPTKGLDRSCNLILWSLTIPFLAALIMFAMGKGGHASELTEGYRLKGPFGHPNILAFFCLISLNIILFRGGTLAEKGPVTKAMLAYMAISSLVLLLATKTRSAWVATFMCIIIHSVIFNRRALLLIPVIAGLALTIPEIRERIFEVGHQTYFSYARTSNSYEWRKLLWADSLNSLNHKDLILGRGGGSFFRESLDFFSIAGRTPVGAHNIFVQLIYETGLLGAAIYVGTLLGLLYKIACTAAAHSDRTKIFGCLLLGAYATIGYSDNLLSYVAFNCYFFFIIGSIIGELSRNQHEHSN